MIARVSEVRFFDLTLEEDWAVSEKVLMEELQLASDVIKIVVFFDSVPLHRSSNVTSARALCTKLKSTLPTAQIIACGPYCMIRKEHERVADVTIVNEPECSIIPVLEGQLEDGCLTSEDDSIRQIRLLTSLEHLPIPDRSLLPKHCETPVSEHNSQQLALSAVVSTTRGCSGACTFCPRGAWNQRKIRHRPIDTVVEEIYRLIQLGYRNIWIDDENMGVDAEWSISLFRKITVVNPDRDCGLYISAWGGLPERFFEYAFRAGVRIVSFGVESGSDAVLRYFRKPVKARSISDSISHADRHGIFTVANLIIGAPCETDEDVSKTIEFLRNVPIDEAHVKILSYIRGATLWENAVKDGRISEYEECVFADADRGLSNRSFNILKKQQEHIRNIFAGDVHRRSRLASKIAQYGTPYLLK